MQSENKDDSIQLPTRYQQYMFAKRYLRGQRKPKVFPITEVGMGAENPEVCLATREDGSQRNGTYVATNPKVGTLRTHKDGNGFRESKSGLSPTIPARAREDGSGQPVILQKPFIATERGRYNSDGSTSQQLEPRKDNLTNTLTSVEKDNRVIDGMQIRRLTPTECERLQGFPDGWTAKGIDINGNEVIISDTQRYKCIGNAVTINVVEAIARNLKAVFSEI